MEQGAPWLVGLDYSVKRNIAYIRKAAIACNLALGMSTIAAVKKANLYIEAGIKTSSGIGAGNGPINHFHSTYTLPFGP